MEGYLTLSKLGTKKYPTIENCYELTEWTPRTIVKVFGLVGD